MRDDGQASYSAMTAAAARAAHLIVDAAPHLFADTLAYPLLGAQAEDFVRYHREHGAHPILAGARTAAATRSRFTEDRLAEAVRRGVRQYVILGAGLDTYAYRAAAALDTHAHAQAAPPIRTFEVDHPATQQWKRAALDEAGIAVPDTLAFVPLDFEHADTAQLPGLLAAGGLDPGEPAFVGWLGVTMYLTPEALDGTLAALAQLAPGTELVMDHMLPAELRDAAGQAFVDGVAPVSAERGEPWRSFLSPADAAALLAAHGFEVLEHAGQRESVDAALWEREDGLHPAALSMLTRARLG